MIIGSDHSRFDWMSGGGTYSPIDWSRSQAVFTFLKACDGASDTPRYADEIVAARKAGKLAAPYVWLYQGTVVDVVSQANFWYSRLKNEPLIAIDFEGYTNSYPNASDLYGAIERLRVLGYAGKIIIYTGHYYWLTHGNTQSYWKQFPVWLARYSTYPPQITPPWLGYDIWQFSSTGDPEKYGITNGKMAVDENRFDGTPDELAELFGAAIPPEPPIGETMITIATVISPTLNVRSTPDLDSTTNIIGPGFLKAGDLLHCVEETTTCIRLTKAQRGATALVLPGPVCWVSIGAAYVRQIWHIANDAALPVNVNVTANGAQVHNKDVPAGGAVAIDITD
jgi:GH25 family lysozyme M1 (1,4-beta-N-acetylmuramidase)